jgi:hypothetical protein
VTGRMSSEGPLPRTLHVISLLLFLTAADAVATWLRRQAATLEPHASTTGFDNLAPRAGDSDACVSVYDYSWDVNLRDQSLKLSASQKWDERKEELEWRHLWIFLNNSGSPLAGQSSLATVISDDLVLVVCSSRGHRYFQSRWVTRTKPFSPQIHVGDRLIHPWLFFSDPRHRHIDMGWDVFSPANIQQ